MLKQSIFKIFLINSIFIFSQNIFPEQSLSHECGIALVRLLKPISYYSTKYSDPLWGLSKLCILIEKQRNRGQDGAGVALVKLNMQPNDQYIHRIRSASKNSLENLFSKISEKIKHYKNLNKTWTDLEIKQNNELAGELYLGHIRYGTYASNGIKFCQPFISKNGVPSKNIAIAGNFNMTNNAELRSLLISLGIIPTNASDTYLIMQQILCLLDKYNNDIVQALQNASQFWDGGYVIGGLTGNGDTFICKDPSGIRPGYYYLDDEVFAAASEPAPLMNAFNVTEDKIHEIQPATVIVIKNDGNIEQSLFTRPLEKRSCVFEEVYFKRPNNKKTNIYRKRLGENLTKRVFNIFGKHQIIKSIFSFIPNTAETAFYGMIEKMNELIGKNSTRIEKLIYKDQAVRTFITAEVMRSDLVSNVYDITQGIVKEDDTLIVVDDSIVRGTTLRDSIITQLIRLNPKDIVVLSTAPLIMYPDCYGIDMSEIGKLIAFQAAIELTKEKGNSNLIEEIYQECNQLTSSNNTITQNPVKKIYDQFSQEEIEDKISELVYPKNIGWKGKIKVLFQTLDGLHNAIPECSGDWYFSGNYPTPGGYKVLCNSYINWYLGNKERAY